MYKEHTMIASFVVFSLSILMLVAPLLPILAMVLPPGRTYESVLARTPPILPDIRLIEFDLIREEETYVL